MAKTFSLFLAIIGEYYLISNDWNNSFTEMTYYGISEVMANYIALHIHAV